MKLNTIMEEKILYLGSKAVINTNPWVISIFGDKGLLGESAPFNFDHGNVFNIRIPIKKMGTILHLLLIEAELEIPLLIRSSGKIIKKNKDIGMSNDKIKEDLKKLLNTKGEIELSVGTRNAEINFPSLLVNGGDTMIIDNLSLK